MTAQPLAAQPVEAIPQPQPVHMAPPPQQHQMVQTQTVYVHKPILDSMFSGKVVAIMSIVGVILLLVGAMISVSAKVSDNINNDDIADKWAAAEFQYKLGLVMLLFGAMLMLLFMVGAAAMSPDIPVNVRVAFLIFAGIVIFAVVSIVLGYTTPMANTTPDIHHS